MTNRQTFIGIQNYIKVLSDSAFWESFGVNLELGIWTIIGSNIFGFFIAYFLNEKLYCRSVIRTLFFIPNVISTVLISFIWVFIYSQVMPAIGHAIISQAPYRFLYEEQTNIAGMSGAVLNAMFTVLCCYLILLVKSLRWHPRVRMLAIVSLIVMSSVSEMPIAMPAITMIFDTAYQVYRKNGDRSVLKKTFLYAIAACYFFYVYPQEAAIYGSGMQAVLRSAGGLCMLLLAAVAILTFYNGKRLPIWKEFNKWLFYFLYPAHLVLLALIRFFIK